MSTILVTNEAANGEQHTICFWWRPEGISRRDVLGRLPDGIRDLFGEVVGTNVTGVSMDLLIPKDPARLAPQK